MTAGLRMAITLIGRISVVAAVFGCLTVTLLVAILAIVGGLVTVLLYAIAPHNIPNDFTIAVGAIAVIVGYVLMIKGFSWFEKTAWPQKREWNQFYDGPVFFDGDREGDYYAMQATSGLADRVREALRHYLSIAYTDLRRRFDHIVRMLQDPRA